MNYVKRAWPWAALVLILVLSAWFSIGVLWKYDTSQYDIFHYFEDGTRLNKGQNPYARVLQGDMFTNNKYATVFPAFFLLSAFTQQHRFTYYNNWLLLWRITFLLFTLATTGLFFLWFQRARAPVLGILMALIWSFNRWTLYSTMVGEFGVIPVFFLALSIFLLPKNRWLGLLSFSVSLAFKQIAIFTVPLYLIWVYHTSPNRKLRQTLLAGLVITSIPLLLSLPFMIWDLKGFVYSIMFSVTRNQFQENPPGYSVDMYLAMSGILSRLPMLALMATVYLAAWRYRLSVSLSSLLVMGIFLSFNAILLNQYFCWFILFVPPLVYEIITQRPVLQSLSPSA